MYIYQMGNQTNSWQTEAAELAGHEMKPTKRGRKGHHRVSCLCVRGRVVISCLGCKYTFVHCVISVLEGKSENKLLVSNLISSIKCII